MLERSTSSEPSSASRPIVEPGRLGDLADREQHAGHERRPVVGVVADRRGSGRSCRAAPPGARPCPAAAPSAPGSRRRGRRARPRRRPLVVGSSAQSFDAAAMRCAVSTAVPDGASIFWSWCSSMISARLEERRRHLREAHHQHRADREVRRDHRVRRRRRRRARRTRRARPRVKPVVPTTACTPFVRAPARCSRGPRRAP